MQSVSDAKHLKLVVSQQAAKITAVVVNYSYSRVSVCHPLHLSCNSENFLSNRFGELKVPIALLPCEAVGKLWPVATKRNTKKMRKKPVMAYFNRCNFL